MTPKTTTERWEFWPGRFAGRSALWIAVLAAYGALYARTASWGWLGFDDYSLISTNANLGHGWSSVGWALTDVRYLGRWMPLGWLPVALGGTALQLHLLVLALGAVLCVLVAEMYRQFSPGVFALPFALLFVASPLRLEAFGSIVGYLYTLTAIFGVLAVLDRRTRWRAVLWLLCALLTYPQAAGFLLIGAWCWRGSRASWVLLGSLAAMIMLQYWLRVRMGWLPMQHHWALLPWTLGHEFASLVMPIVTVPIFPPVYYPLEWLGLAVMAALLFWRPSILAVCLILFLPTLAAAVSEPFAFCARYSTFMSVAAFGLLAAALSTSSRKWIALPVAALAAMWAFGNLTDDGLAHGRYGAERRALAEAKLLGVTISSPVPQVDK